MEYNSSLLTYVKASLGADAAYGFSISITNPNLHFFPTTPGTDDNVLVQISGGGSKTFSGSGIKIVVLEFELVGNYGDSSPLAFDEGSTKTYLSTASLCYRLKQVDTDGHFTLSEIKFITLRTPIKFNLEKNYPNPFNQKTMIHY